MSLTINGVLPIALAVPVCEARRPGNVDAIMSERQTGGKDRWYWLAVTALLAVGVAHWSPALALVHLVCAVRTLQLAFSARSLNAFPVQVNVAFLALVVATNLSAPSTLFITALILAGVRAATGYCAIARLLALLPFNRREPWSLALVKRTFLMPPTSGTTLKDAAEEGARA